MKIAIEALGIHRYGGGRTATINLLRSIFLIDKQNQYFLVLSQPEPELDFENVHQHVFRIENRFIMRIYAQLALPILTQRYDLVHFTKNLGIFGLQIPYIVTIYDVAPLIYPNIFPKIDVLYWKYFQKLTLNKAAKIIAISYQTANDIELFYKVESSKIKVIYPAHNHNFYPRSKSEVEEVKSKYHLPDQYVLYVGRIDPRKNIPLLIRAFSIFCEQTNFHGILVLVGEEYRKRPDKAIYNCISRLNLHERVRLLGAVPDLDLPALYTGATMAVLPSIHEGFGIAALEALACGTPLIVNRAGAIMEVVDDAALIMERNTPECLADLMKFLWNNPSVRRDLQKAGIQRASIFSWERAAIQTISVYSEVIGP